MPRMYMCLGYIADHMGLLKLPDPQTCGRNTGGQVYDSNSMASLTWLLDAGYASEPTPLHGRGLPAILTCYIYRFAGIAHSSQGLRDKVRAQPLSCPSISGRKFRGLSILRIHALFYR